MLQIVCKHCGRMLRIPEEYVGKTGTCNYCKKAITVILSDDTASNRTHKSSNNGSSVQGKFPPEWYEERRAHFEYCRHNYADATRLFGGLPKDLRGEDATTKAIAAKGDATRQKALCEEAVAEGADAPWAYERLAVLYAKEGRKMDAYGVCILFFSEPRRWRVPNWSTTSLKLLERMQRLQEASFD
jgi:hypothetical protein